MRRIRALRALARVELRQLRRHRGRTLLVLLLVAVPVAAVVCGSTLVHIAEATGEERAIAAMGRADLRVDGADTYEKFQRIRAALPSEAEIERWFVGIETVRTPGRRLRARLHALSPDALEPGGLAAGALVMQAGRAPVNAGEVALSRSLMSDLELSIGDEVTLAYGVARSITGIVCDPEDLDAPLALRTPAHVEYRGAHLLLAQLSAADAEGAAMRLRAEGFEVSTRPERSAEQDGLGVTVVFAVGALGFFEAGLVIAAAFAVGLRRRQHEIGLLGSIGAPTWEIALSMVASAVIVALLGGALGTSIGLSGAAAAHPFLDGWLRRQNGGFEVPSGQIVAAVLLGALAAALAAALPARRAARVPIREALSGRRPAPTRSQGWLALGSLMLFAGVALVMLAPRDHPATATLGIIGGPILMIVGLGACTPWLLDRLAQWAAPLPVAWRLAVRDAGRFRSRNGPVVTAVLAGMSVSVAAAVVVASVESAIDAFPPPYRDDQLLIEGPGAEDVARRLREALPVIGASPLMATYARGEPVRARWSGSDASGGRREWVACGGMDLLRALSAEGAEEDFRAGRLIALNPPRDASELALTAWLTGRRIDGPAVAKFALNQPVAAPLFALNEASLERLGLASGPPLNSSLVPWLVRLDAPVTKSAIARARLIAAASRGATIDGAILQERPARTFYYGALLVCGLMGMTIIAVASALTSAESAGDERVLHTVGAAPGMMRTHLAARAAYLAFLGCALSVPAGLITALALFDTVNFPLAFVMPWRDVVITALGFPLAVFAGAWLAGMRRRARVVAWRDME